MKTFVSCCALVMSLACAASARAQEPTLDEMLRSAGLVFRGTVRSVEHRLSEVSEEAPNPLPYTFVTYDVQETLKGAVGSAQLTLRFFGGPIDEDRFVLLPHTPLFDVGDSDLLVVGDVEQRACPLVSCPGGRFRLVSDLVASEEGIQLIRGDDGTLGFGPALALEEVRTHAVSDDIQIQLEEVDEPGEEGRITPEEAILRLAARREVPIDPADFTDFVARRIARLHTPEELARARAQLTPSANPDVPITPFVMLAMAPPDEGRAPLATAAEAAVGSAGEPQEATTAPPIAQLTPLREGRPARANHTSSRPALALVASAGIGALVLLAVGALLRARRRGSPPRRGKARRG